MDAAPVLSVVVPAHDEGRVVGRCLDRLAPLIDDGRAEVVVVANGCSDDTADAARRAGVRVIELPEASKAAALNAGDAAVSAFPRVYLDADIEVGPEALLALAEALPGDRALVGSPTVRFELAGRPWTVRAYYRVYTALPYVTDGLIGLGLYAVSRAGRTRFERFPAITADDLFVQRSFEAGERVVLAEHAFTVQTPRTLAALVKVRTRSVAGTWEAAASYPGDAFASSTADSGRALVRLALTRPWLLPDIAVYVGVTLAARRRATRAATDSAVRWERDDTTR
jgi:glycosyltransferase involved in cell wall biosynthesis